MRSGWEDPEYRSLRTSAGAYRGRVGATPANEVRYARGCGQDGSYLVLEYEAMQDPYEGIPKYVDRLREAIVAVGKD